MVRILIVDDEANMRRVLGVLLRRDGHEVREAANLAEARRLLEAETHDVVLTDQRLPDGEGLSLVPVCRCLDPAPPVILLTAYASLDLAVAALREGAFDFLTKPFNPGVVRGAITRAAEHMALTRENARLRDLVDRLSGPAALVGVSPAMEALRALVARVAPAQATVLITGETGTGKELVARAIHDTSPRADRPFLAVNCAAVPEQLLESQLFGHERGAFTGADHAHRGFFESAHEGTLFLDEAGEMSLGLQAKLLRVLVDGEVLRVGATEARHVDVRVLVATHRDLRALVRESRFREDLFYRLNVVPIAVPSLRERPGDIPALVEHFSARVAREMKLPQRPVAPDALADLLTYPFPGNVRELRNLVERAYILGQGDVLARADFQLPGGAPGQSPTGATCSLEQAVTGLPATVDLRNTVEHIERTLLRRALREAGGAQAEAGRRLGLSRSDMTYKVRKYGLEDETR